MYTVTYSKQPSIRKFHLYQTFVVPGKDFKKFRICIFLEFALVLNVFAALLIQRRNSFLQLLLELPNIKKIIGNGSLWSVWLIGLVFYMTVPQTQLSLGSSREFFLADKFSIPHFLL